ncbi:hypothetical protein B0H14DRAFT_2569201 [Mycena olivaceomarginata]|nr:hypothetical protein B0H14DRAFT_2569201 [Mycena olivaceomarginata]
MLAGGGVMMPVCDFEGEHAGGVEVLDLRAAESFWSTTRLHLGRRAGTVEPSPVFPNSGAELDDLEDERKQYVLIDYDIVLHAATQRKLRAYAAKWRGVSSRADSISAGAGPYALRLLRPAASTASVPDVTIPVLFLHLLIHTRRGPTHPPCALPLPHHALLDVPPCADEQRSASTTMVWVTATCSRSTHPLSHRPPHARLPLWSRYFPRPAAPWLAAPHSVTIGLCIATPMPVCLHIMHNSVSASRSLVVNEHHRPSFELYNPTAYSSVCSLLRENFMDGLHSGINKTTMQHDLADGIQDDEPLASDQPRPPGPSVFITALFASTFLHDDAGLAGLTITAALTFSESVYWAYRFWTALELALDSVKRIIEYTDLPPPAT